MIARTYGQPPESVAEWAPEWLAAASMLLVAENGAAEERQRRAARKAKMARRQGA